MYEEGKFSGVSQDNDGLHLVMFAPGEHEHAHKVRLTLDDQMLIFNTIAERVFGKAFLLARMRAGAPISPKDAP
jgi:hypothetical protein